MSKHLIWSAINISEGRDLDRLRALTLALKDAGVRLADWSADPDHNRSVFSLVDTATNLRAGVQLIFGWALKHLDIRTHTGMHPRLGVVDVVPFSPLGHSTLEEAQAAAFSCAQDTARAFGLPIFLYRDSSLDPLHPLTLPSLRKGGLEGLRARLMSKELKASFGPAGVHPQLGISVFGARPNLVAFNCMLGSTDLSLGKIIAQKVRQTGGGLDGLQALAFKLESRKGAIQISMNLIKPDKTPPHLAYLKVVEEAAKFGIEVTSSELVGLIPEQALGAAFKHFLKLESLHSGQVAELCLINEDCDNE